MCAPYGRLVVLHVTIIVGGDGDRDDRRLGGGDRRPGPAQDRARPRAPPGRAPRKRVDAIAHRRRSARMPSAPTGDPVDARRPRPAVRAPRPGRRRTRPARRRRDLGGGARLRPRRGRRDLERRPEQRRPPLVGGRRRHATSIGRPTSRTATRSTATGGSSPASTVCGGSPATSATAVADDRRRPVRGPAAQLAQRHRRRLGRRDLVHRSAVRDPRRPRGLQGRLRAGRLLRLPPGPRRPAS